MRGSTTEKKVWQSAGHIRFRDAPATTRPRLHRHVKPGQPPGFGGDGWGPGFRFWWS
ncbi:MAG: hypothetical protein PHN79_03555 [Methanoregula sp.]|nr:hypothetical protein [Methanoregula sp.]